MSGIDPFPAPSVRRAFTEHGGTMRGLIQIPIACLLTVIACQNRRAADSNDSALAQRSAEPSTPTPASPGPAPGPVDPTAGLAKGKEAGTIPATPTPAVTSENSIAAMRQHLQRLDTASATGLQRSMQQHSRMLGDLLTTMRVEVSAATSPAKETWLAAADTVEGDLNRLALAQGQELTTAFRAHRTRVLQLLDEFRVLVPVKSM